VSGFKLLWKVLPPAQLELWPQLKTSLESGFVLYGGTAAALRLGHRSSVDFDFFTERALDREKLQSGFAFLRHSIVVQDRPDTLTVMAPAAKASVKISFFGGIDTGRVGVPDLTSDGAVEIASLLDLLATKLKVIQQRIEVKDYTDIAAILRAGTRLEDGLAAASALYTASFQPSESLKALTYFEGGDLADLRKEDRQTLVTAARAVRHIPVSARKSQQLSALD
jgi:hypothetical protein